MANILIQSPFEYVTDRMGRALANGKIYIGLVNQDPEQFPVATFFDLAGTIPAPQPIRTNAGGFPCDASGNPQRVFTPEAYSIKINDQNNAQVVYAANAAEGFFGVIASDLADQTDPALGTGLVGWIYDGGGAVGSTLQDRLQRGWVDVKDFGAIGDGLANDKAAFDAAASTGRSILLPEGTYNVPSGDYSMVRFYSFDGATTTNGTIAVVDPLANSLAVGTEASFPCAPSALPFGWVHLNGALLNRLTYPQLWAFANSSGNIVDEVDKPTNQLAFGRGNGTSTFSLPDKRGSVQGYADASAGVDATLVLGKLVNKDSALGVADVKLKVGVSTPAIRAFATAVNTGTIDITALQAQVNQNTTDITEMFGVDQTWQDVTGSRAKDSTYTNATGKPINVVVSGSTVGTAGSMRMLVNGSIIVGLTSWGSVSIGNYPWSISAVIPIGATYLVTGGGNVSSWSELR